MPRSEPTPAAVDEAEMASRLRLATTRLARRLRREASSGYSPSQLSVLAVVHNHGPLTLGAIAEQERVAPPTITRVVAKLEADGLLQRTTDPTDGRVSLMSVTSTGEELVVDTRRRKTTWLAARVSALSAEEKVRLAAALDVIEHINSLGDEP